MIKDVEIDKLNAKHVFKYYQDSSKISQSLKLRGECLQNNGHHKKAMTCPFHEQIELL